VDKNNNFDRLINENLYFKKQLSYFIPSDDTLITGEDVKPIPPNFPFDAPDIKSVRSKGKKVSYHVNFNNKEYRRPIYDPNWVDNLKKRWCYVPRQVYLNSYRLFPIPEKSDDLFEGFSFHETFQPIKTYESGFLIYKFTVSDVIVYDNQILLSGTPIRNGAQIITINRANLQNNKDYLVRIVTQDNEEIDYAIF
jgi:hypothetical protein